MSIAARCSPNSQANCRRSSFASLSRSKIATEFSGGEASTCGRSRESCCSGKIRHPSPFELVNANLALIA